jgi:CheY-like chemotaxis protein
VLTAAGHTVVEARDGAEGRNFNRAEPADLIITDIFMPNMGGMEVLRELRREAPSVKIIAISGGGIYGGSGYLEAAKILGSTFTLAKPFTPNDLLELVERASGQND